MIELNGVGVQVQAVVGTTAVQLSKQMLGQERGRADKVVLQGITANRSSIFVKNESDVAADGHTGGFEIPPGGNIILPTAEYEKYYAIAGLANQKLQVTYLGGL